MTSLSTSVLRRNLHITYATDNSYAQHVAVSLYSLYKSSNKPEQYVVWILDNKLSDDNKQKLQQVAESFHQKISFIDISNLMSLLPSDIDVANLSISTYSRLFVTRILPEDIKLLLYLDCDTYVCKDLLDIYESLPCNNKWAVAGVEDTMYPHMKESIGLNKDSLYINAGVLLINMDLWRQINAPKVFVEYIKRYNGAVPHLDQGVINGVFKNEKVRLPLSFNVQAPIYVFKHLDSLRKFYSIDMFYDENEVNNAKSNPSIIHFTSFFVERPWYKFCLHPMKHLYRKDLLNTPFANSTLQTNNIGVVQMIKDICFNKIQSLYLKFR